jgi:hypothetical protein
MKLLHIFLILLFGTLVYGDVMYEMQTTTEGMMGMGGQTVMRVYVKGDYSRTETMSESETAEPTDITIIRLDKGVVWNLNPTKKEYTKTTFDEISAAAEGIEGEEEPGIELPEIKLEKPGNKKKILGKECEQIVVSMDATSEEGGEATFTQTMWVTKEIPGYMEIVAFNKKMPVIGIKSSTPMMGGSTKSYTEFQEKLKDIEGFPLELDMDMTMGAEGMSFSITMHSVVTGFDTKTLDKSLFEIPAGYTLKK